MVKIPPPLKYIDTMDSAAQKTCRGQTSLPEAIHASPPVHPDSDEAKQITVTAGRKCLEGYQNLGPIGLLTKMLLDQSVTWYSTKRLLTWKVSATPARRSIFQLLPSMQIIPGKEFGLLPTPMYKDGESYYILTLDQSLKRERKNIHWGHKGMLFYGLKKGKANPLFSLYLMGYPTTLLDLEPQETQLSMLFQ